MHDSETHPIRVIAVTGSPNGSRGGTAALLRFLVRGAEAAGGEVEVVHLAHVDVGPCKAIGTCHRTGACGQPDRFEVVRRKIMEADALVLASPNYLSNVSAQMKAFMDRCCGVVHCGAFRGRYGAAVVTAGGGGADEVVGVLKKFLLSTGVVPVGAVEAVVGAVVGDREPGELLEDPCLRAEALGATLVRACREEASYPEAEATIAELQARMRQLVALHRDEWTHEYEVWRGGDDDA